MPLLQPPYQTFMFVTAVCFAVYASPLAGISVFNSQECASYSYTWIAPTIGKFSNNVRNQYARADAGAGGSVAENEIYPA